MNERSQADSWRQWASLIALLVQRDLRVRYRGSFLGYLWSMMNPLLYMGILSFVFAHIMKFNIEHFPMFILSGILAWNLFAQSLSIGVHSIVANGALLRKVKVPATIFPAASVCSCLVNFTLALFPFIVISLATGLKLTGWIFMIPLILIPFLLFVFGVTLLLGSLNVSFRDVGHTLEPLLQMVFYATPVLYPIESLPERYRSLAMLNPMAHFVTEIRGVLFYGTPPSAQKLAALAGIAVLSLGLGGFVYRRMRNGFVYNV